MPRSEARIHTVVWRNKDFTSLSRSAQGLYWMLLSQPDVSLAGVVSYVPQRWAALSTDSAESIDDDLADLDGLLLVDRTTGEVWIRAFPKWDGVLRNVKLRAGMWKAWTAIFSPKIRTEFMRAIGNKHVQEAVDEGWIGAEDVPHVDTDGTADAPSPTRNGTQDMASDGVSDMAYPLWKTTQDDPGSTQEPPPPPLPPPPTPPPPRAHPDEVIEQIRTHFTSDPFGGMSENGMSRFADRLGELLEGGWEADEIVGELTEGSWDEIRNPGAVMFNASKQLPTRRRPLSVLTEERYQNRSGLDLEAG